MFGLNDTEHIDTTTSIFFILQFYFYFIKIIGLIKKIKLIKKN